MDQIGRISKRISRFFRDKRSMGDEEHPEAKAAQAAWLKLNECAYTYIYFLIILNLYNPITDLNLGFDV
jgi:hypothetical protein